MGTEARSYAKFFVKQRIVAPLRSVLLFFLGGEPRRDGWKNRMLIVNLEGLGDMVVFTSVLKHYRRRFPDLTLYLLMKGGIGIEEFLVPAFVDSVLTLDYRRFAVDPWYGAAYIARLRRIGFHTVINHDFSASEIQGKVIATSVGAEEIIGYQGLGVEFRHPFDWQQKRNLAIARRRIYPRYTRIISGIDASCDDPAILPSAIAHYVRIYEAVTGSTEAEYAPYIPLSSKLTAASQDLLRTFGIRERNYVILNIHASVPYKRWPIAYFARVAERIIHEGFAVVTVGTMREKPLTRAFLAMCPVSVRDLTGRTNITELLLLLLSSYFVVTNDTALVHLAVALRVPSLCITGGGQFGMFSDYGYAGINRWIYVRTGCYGDNWRCGKNVAPGLAAPCVLAVTPEAVLREMTSLIQYLRGGGVRKEKSTEEFHFHK